MADRAWTRTMRSYRAELDGRIARFENTENTCKKFMELKAPSQYWSNKAEGQDFRALVFGALSAAWAGVAGWFLWRFLNGL